jgi:hypothetical protein
MRSRLQQAIEAYRDGGLSPRKRRAIERVLERDAEASRHLRESESLGRLIRQSWNDGPPSPPADRFLAAIRPELQRIDAERAERKRRQAPRRRPVLRSFAYAASGLAAAAALVIGIDVSSRRERAERPAFVDADLSLPLVMERPEFDRELAFDDLYPRDARPRESGWPSVERVGMTRDRDSRRGPRAAIYDLYQGDDAALLIYDGEDESLDSPVLIFAIPEDGEPVSAVPASYSGGLS